MIDLQHEPVFYFESDFYKEKSDSNKYQFKEARIKIVKFLPDNPEVGIKICSDRFDLAKYVGQGRVRDSITLTGSDAFLAEYEVLIEIPGGEVLPPQLRSTIV